MDEQLPPNNTAQGQPPDLNGAAVEDDDFGEFGGFEAADPVPPNVAQPAIQGEAGSSPWAVFPTVQSSLRPQPDLLCAQNAFPQYLDPSGIAGGATGPVGAEAPLNNGIGGDNVALFEANFDLDDVNENASATDQSRIAENVLDGTLNSSPRNVSYNAPGPGQGTDMSLQGSVVGVPLPDLGIGASMGRGAGVSPLWSDPNTAQTTDAAPQQLASASVSEASQGRPEGEASVPAGQAAMGGGISGRTESEKESSDRSIAEENENMKKDLELLNTKNVKLEEELARTEAELDEQRVRLEEIQGRHNDQLVEVRKAGHDALAVVVEEYKELSRTAVLEQQEVSLRHLQEKLKEQAELFQRVLESQAEDLKKEQEKELAKCEEKHKQSMETAREEQQKKFDAFLEEERMKQKDALQKAVEDERDANEELMKEAILKEQEKAAKLLEEEREKFTKIVQQEKENCTEDIKTAIENERVKNQELIRETVEEERTRSKEAVEETKKTTREDIQTYIQEQRQSDSLMRQRHLSSLDIFLASAQQQIQLLLEVETGGQTEREKDKKNGNEET